MIPAVDSAYIGYDGKETALISCKASVYMIFPNSVSGVVAFFDYLVILKQRAALAAGI